MAGGRIGSQGVDRAFSVMEQLAAHMTKNMAQSLVRNAFLLAHAMIREFFDAPVDVKVQGRWENQIPSQWKVRHAVDVKIGMSPNERARKEQTMRAIVDAQVALAQQGEDGTLVDSERFYKALTDWGRFAEIPNPEQYFIDPATPESQEAKKQKQQQAALAQKQSRALMQQAVGLEQLRAAMDKYKADLEYQFKYWAETLKAEIEEAKIVGSATTDLVKQTRFGDKTNGKGESGTDAVDSTDGE